MFRLKLDAPADGRLLVRKHAQRFGAELAATQAGGENGFIEPAGAIQVGGRNFKPDNAAGALLLLWLRCHAASVGQPS